MSDQHGQAVWRERQIERAREWGQLLELGILIVGVATFFVFPIRILSGDADAPREFVLGSIGMLFWAFAAVTVVNHYGL